MSLSVSTPSRNFSRPFPSPLNLTPSPIKASHGRKTTLHQALTDMPLSAPIFKSSEDSSRERSISKMLDSTRGSASARRPFTFSSSAQPSFTSAHQRRTSTSSSLSTATTEPSSDLVDPSRPIPNFRSNLWRHLDRARENLNLDLFWPIQLGDLTDTEDLLDDSAIFPLHELKPLTTFYNLRTLALHGMMRSYQQSIWETCWLNPNLTTLILEMALEPIMLPPTLPNDTDIPLWLNIDVDWLNSYEQKSGKPPLQTLKSSTSTEASGSFYLGAHGQGTLHEEFGDGEYLDTVAILDARPQVVHLQYLSIKKLVLTGFVVDALPFNDWFDPDTLRQIVFKDHCIDAGFSLPVRMSKVEVCFSGDGSKKSVVAKGSKVEIVTIGNPMDGHQEDTPALRGANGSRGGLRKKISGMLLPKWRAGSTRDAP